MWWRTNAVGRDDIAPGLVGLGGETEIAGLHPHGQQRERQGDKGIDIGDDTVGLLPENTGIVRREQIAQKPHHDGADAVDGRLFRQFFEHNQGKDTNKPSEKSKLACIFSEAQYLGRSQRIRISESKSKFICILPRRRILDEVKDKRISRTQNRKRTRTGAFDSAAQRRKGPNTTIRPKFIFTGPEYPISFYIFAR